MRAKAPTLFLVQRSQSLSVESIIPRLSCVSVLRHVCGAVFMDKADYFFVKNVVC